MPDIPFYDLGPAAHARREDLHRVLDDVIDRGYFVGGSAVVSFEKEFADYLGVAECVGVGNGLDALRIGMEALGIGAGDEVIVPGFTFYATWLAVTQTGATPVAVDVQETTAGIDIDAVRSAITSRTKAIVVVHLYGVPSDLARLRELADEANIRLIEDAAQSHGSRSGTAMTGSVGDFAAFSFYPTKNLGAFGDGGIIATNSSEIAAVARRRRSYGQGASKYEHVDTGWNSRLDTLQAAFLSDGLPRVDEQNDRRRQIARRYLEALGSGAGRVVGSEHVDSAVWHQFVLRANDRDAARVYFDWLGIHTDIHYPYYFNDVAPMKKYVSRHLLAQSELLSRQVLSFPISPWLTDAEVEWVADGLASVPTESLSESLASDR